MPAPRTIARTSFHAADGGTISYRIGLNGPEIKTMR
jgi:hypothetical protein